MRGAHVIPRAIEEVDALAVPSRKLPTLYKAFFVAILSIPLLTIACEILVAGLPGFQFREYHATFLVVSAVMAFLLWRNGIFT